MRGQQDAVDEGLRARLRAVDPAAASPPLDPRWLAAKVGDVVAVSEQGTRNSAPQRRRRRVVLAGIGVAVAAVAVVAVVPGNGPGAVSRFQDPAQDPVTAICAPVDAESLSQRPTAFAARVTAIEGRDVTLEVVERFEGQVEDRVVVTQPAEGAADFSATSFTDGATYLLSADGTALAACGLSGPDTPELRALYAQAFPG